MARLSVVLLAVAALCSTITTAKNLPPPVSVSDSGPTESSNSTKSSDLQRPTAHPVPPPVLNTKSASELGANISFFNLQDMISFFTGTKDVVNSNFTLFAGNNKKNGTIAKVLATERFAKAVENAKRTDSSVMLIFTDKERYKEAQAEWEWINGDQTHHVFLVTKSKECDRGIDDPDDVQLWDITEAKFNNFGKSVTFTGQAVEFVDVFKYWSLKASNTGIIQQAGQQRQTNLNTTTLQERFIDTQGQINLDYQIDPSLGMTWGNTPLSILPVGSASDPVGSITCQTCSVRGTFDWDLDIGTSSSDLIAGKIQFTARNVGATLQPKLSLYGTGTEVFEHEMPIWGMGIPYAEIYASKWFDVGATISLILRVKIEKNPEPMAITAGFNISLAEEAVVKIDLENPEKSEVSGWVPQVDSLEPEVSSNASVKITVGPRLLLTYGLEVLSQGAQVGLIFGGGNVDFQVKTQDPTGSCSKQRKNLSKTPDSLAIQGGVVNDIAAFAEAKLVKAAATTKTLASTSTELFSMCRTFNAGLLETPTIAAQQVNSFTPNILSKAKDEVASLTDKAKEGVKSVAATVTSAVGSVASEVKEGVYVGCWGG